MTLDEMLGLAPVIPVLVIERVEDAVPLARALVTGGLRLLEVTLRTTSALDCIARIVSEVEGAVVGAGTVLTPKDLDRAAQAGARFAVSPGFSPALSGGPLPMLPGVATASEVMAAMEAGHVLMKLFPAEPVGGATLLKAWAGPLPQARFCPTGGVTPQNARNYLDLPNVVCVGGSWLAPPDALGRRDWSRIEALARSAADLRASPA